MKKQINALKLTFLGAAAVAALGVGCASTEHAQVDTDHHITDADETAAAQTTVSPFGRTFETRAEYLGRFPFSEYPLCTIETYTFAVPDSNLNVTNPDSDLPAFSASLPPGTVYVEAAGGAGEVRAGRVIRHTPNPSR